MIEPPTRPALKRYSFGWIRQNSSTSALRLAATIYLHILWAPPDGTGDTRSGSL
jgi:hypothetical protein